MVKGRKVDLAHLLAPVAHSSNDPGQKCRVHTMPDTADQRHRTIDDQGIVESIGPWRRDHSQPTRCREHWNHQTVVVTITALGIDLIGPIEKADVLERPVDDRWRCHQPCRRPPQRGSIRTMFEHSPRSKHEFGAVEAPLANRPRKFDR